MSDGHAVLIVHNFKFRIDVYALYVSFKKFEIFKTF